MTFQEAKDLAKSKSGFIGKPFSDFKVKSVIPLPDNVDLRDMTAYIRTYLATNDIDIAAKVAQTENNNYYLGIVADTEFSGTTTPYFGKFEAYFPL